MKYDRQAIQQSNVYTVNNSIHFLCVGFINLLNNIKQTAVPQLRLDLRGAYESGATEHPQILMKKLGYNILKSEPIPIADCWIFEVEELFLPLPEYLKLLED